MEQRKLSNTARESVNWCNHFLWHCVIKLSIHYPVPEQFYSWVNPQQVCLHMCGKSITYKNVLSSIIPNSPKLKAAQLFNRRKEKLITAGESSITGARELGLVKEQV